MIIMIFPYGNHCNRLFQNLHFEAFCKEYGIEYINPSFSDMYDYYISPCNLFKSNILKGLKYKFYKRFVLIVKIMKKLKILKIERFVKIFDTMDNENNIYALSPPHDIYVGGWYFRVHDLTEKYQDYFIGKYTLKDKYIQNNELYNLMIRLKRNDTIITGVHIRRSDYKYHEDGKYYFDDDVYQKYMCTLGDKIKNNYNKNYFFIIFSDEDILINENEHIHKSTNEWYIDNFLMSKCDYLIGPPSTFTLWASYIGKVKYYHITSDSGNINLSDFKYCKG